jgi:hypothetical protein
LQGRQGCTGVSTFQLQRLRYDTSMPASKWATYQGGWRWRT